MRLEDFIRYERATGKWQTKWTARLGEVSAAGDSREDATRNLFTLVREGMEGSYDPVVIAFMGWVAHIWRNPLGDWCYAIRGAGFNGRLDRNSVLIGDYEETIRCARKHLADYVYDGVSVFSHPEEAAEIILDEGDRREFISRCYRTKRAGERV